MASPELQIVIDMLRSAPPVPRDATWAEQRAGLENLVSMAPAPTGASFTPTEAGGVPAEWVAADGVGAERAILYLHGGGYCIGSIRTHRQLAADLSRAAAARVLLIDYRLAPEHPFPAGLDDAVAAYHDMLASGARPAQSAIAGDSAGGGLTAATLLALRDRGAALPAAGVCLSPWFDLTMSSESMTGKAAVDPMVQSDRLEHMARVYLGDTDARTPLASPLFADLHGLPPLLVQVGTAEVLLDDSTRFAQRARAADVDVTLDVWQDMIHVWHGFSLMLPESRQAIDAIGAFLRRRWG
jgi:monoterpene epsilon-lactone hydrolase